MRRLAGSRHGPADWILHARIVIRSWDAKQVEAIAQALDCSPQTVRQRLHRFDAEGIEGLGDRPKEWVAPVLPCSDLNLHHVHDVVEVLDHLSYLLCVNMMAVGVMELCLKRVKLAPGLGVV